MFSHLGSDPIDVILSKIPDFPTLLNAILATKEIHAVFETHPNSIIRAVAQNQVGPALPQAFRVVRLGTDAHSKPMAQAMLKMLPQEAAILESQITRREAGELGRNAAVAHALEDLYSFKYETIHQSKVVSPEFSHRHKDRSSKSSQLSAVESLRFQRALYRYWLFCRLYSRWGFDLGE